MAGHSESKKMELRRKGLEAKQRIHQVRSDLERAQMERMGAPERIFTKFSLLFIGDSWKTFLRIKDDSQFKSFQVTLHSPLPMQEITKRMENAFGDL